MIVKDKRNISFILFFGRNHQHMYTISLVRELAFNLANGLPALYKANDAPHGLVNVPFNWYLADCDILKKHILRLLREQKSDVKLYIINDHYLEPNLRGAFVELSDGHLKDAMPNSHLKIQGDIYQIVINPHQEEADKRFTKVKELASLYTNYYAAANGLTNIQRHQDYEESLKNSHSQRENIRDGSLDSDGFESDTFAILLATELMIPPMYRDFTSTLLDRVKKKEMSMNDIAQSLCMPEYMLQKLIYLNYYEESCKYYSSRMKGDL